MSQKSSYTIKMLFLESRRKQIEGAIMLTLVVLLLVITANSIKANTTSEQRQTVSSISAINNNNSNNQQSQPAPTPLALQAPISGQLSSVVNNNDNQDTNSKSAEQSSEQNSQSSALAAESSNAGQSQSSSMTNSPQSSHSNINQQQQIGQQYQLPIRLPKINIYANKNEVKKLLGIDTRINYVTNGQLNTYPLGFTIPMGYHLSDMIFTWQNLGPTNVNYSISLVIANIQAVERPLINITRSGLIPSHEQVFKITLPCSGKVTDEVDVQVLINIVGLVPVTTLPNLDESPYSSANGVSSGNGGNSGTQTGETDDQTSDYQIARAVHQQQNELMASNFANNQNQNSSGSNSSWNQIQDQMQSDESGQSARRPQTAMRQVSHTIAIKRKKICTMHPVPVTPLARQPEIRPPNQVPGQPDQGAKWTGAATASSVSTTTSTTGVGEQQVVTSAGASTQSLSGAQTGHFVQQNRIGNAQQQHWQSSASHSSSIAAEPPAHQPAWSAQTPPSMQQQHQHQHVALAQGVDSNELTNRLIPGTKSQASSTRPAVASHWPAPRLNPTTSAPAAPLENPLIELLRQQQQNPLGNGGQQQQQHQASSGNPLLFSLILMSLIISIALLALLIIGTTASSKSTSMRHRHPFDKLNALTNCLLRRTQASRAAGHNAGKVGPKIGRPPSSTLVIGPNLTMKQQHQSPFDNFGSQHQHQTHHHNHLGHKLRSHHATLGSPKGGVLSTISGLQHQAKQQQQQQQSTLYYYKQQQQSDYSQSLYHHYQCPPDLLIGNVDQNYANNSTSPYHITMSNQQTTKLFLGTHNNNSSNNNNTGNLDNAAQNYTIDNNYTITPPATLNQHHHHHNNNNNNLQSRSDSGSVYQTIY